MLSRGLESGEAIPQSTLALFHVAVPGESELALVEEIGAVAYARVIGDDGPYLLVGAPPEQVWPQSLTATLLDLDVSGATYLIAYAVGQMQPDWSALGEPLLADSRHALLRTDPNGARSLSEAGLSVRAVTLDPKPLRPAVSSESIDPVAEPDPWVQEMISQVDSATVYSYTADLSGGWAVDLGGDPYTITTRHTDSGEPIHQATLYAGEHLAGLGLQVEYHQWDDATNPNVIGELPGLTEPEEIFIIGAHLDDRPSPPDPAPGADDNASGSVAVLLAADILTQFEWGCTLRFALWTGEEQGLLGSNAYAQRAYQGGEQIAGYLNLDMIAYNSGRSPEIDLHADPLLPDTLTVAQVFSDVVEVYNLNLLPEIVPDGMGSSDHESFWDYGFTSILVIEDLSDFNPHYHTSTDLLQHLDLAYFTDAVKGSIGTFVHVSDCLIRDGIGYVDGHVWDASVGNPIPEATVSSIGASGSVVDSQTDSSGYFSQTLSSGIYTVTVQSVDYFSKTVSDVAITMGQVTRLDVSLAPWLRIYLPLLMVSS